MKKFIVASLALGIAITSQAQTNNGTVTLNVKLNPIQTLVINNGQKEVNLEYKTETDYANGVKSKQDNHLEIYSTGGFEVRVKSSGSELTTNQSGPNGNIKSNSITIVPSAGSQGVEGAQYTSKPLSADDQAIVTATKGGVKKNVSIEYQGAGADAYINNYVAGQNPTVYTTTVTYTILAK